MRLNEKLEYSAGFSFFETLIVSAILASVLAVMLAAWSSAGIDASVNRKVAANRIAIRKIEEFRQTPFSNLPSSGTSTFSDPAMAELSNGAGEIFSENYLSTSSLKHISVIVSWQEGGVTSTYRLDSVFTEGGTRAP